MFQKCDLGQRPLYLLSPLGWTGQEVNLILPGGTVYVLRGDSDRYTTIPLHYTCIGVLDTAKHLSATEIHVALHFKRDPFRRVPVADPCAVLK